MHRASRLATDATSPDLAQGGNVAADACERRAHGPALLDVIRRLCKIARPWGLVGPRLIVGSDTHNERNLVALLQTLKPWRCPDRHRPLWRVWWVVAFGVQALERIQREEVIASSLSLSKRRHFGSSRCSSGGPGCSCFWSCWCHGGGAPSTGSAQGPQSPASHKVHRISKQCTL